MKIADSYSRGVWTVGLMALSAAAVAVEPQSTSPQTTAQTTMAPTTGAQTTAQSMAQTTPPETAPPKTTPPQEPAGFIVGGVIGGLAAGPVGAVIGAGVGTWLGNRVHRAGEAKQAQAEVAALRTDQLRLQTEQLRLQTENAALTAATGDLSAMNRALTVRLDELSHSVEAAESASNDAASDGSPETAGNAAALDGMAESASNDAAPGEAAGSAGNDAALDEAAKVLDGLQGDVLFRTGSADITPEMKQGLEVLAQAVAKAPALKVRVDGYADPRGSVDANLKLSQARADAVRDVLLTAGVSDEALEVNAYGKSQSVAADSDGYAFERRVRLTLQAQEGTKEMSQNVGTNPPGVGSPAGRQAADLEVIDNE